MLRNKTFEWHEARHYIIAESPRRPNLCATQVMVSIRRICYPISGMGRNQTKGGGPLRLARRRFHYTSSEIRRLVRAPQLAWQWRPAEPNRPKSSPEP